MNKLHAIYLLCTALALPALTNAQAPSVVMTITGNGLSANVVATATPSTIYRISKIEFYLDAATTPTFTKFITTLTRPGAPLTTSYKFNCLTEGTHKFTVKAYDNALTPRVGSATTINAINFVDAPPAITGITVSPGSYFDGFNTYYYPSPTNITASANVTDDCGVTKVEFYLNGVLAATRTTAPYQHSFSLVQNTQLQVIAYDQKLRQYPSTSYINLNITNNYAPYPVDITSVTSGVPAVANTNFFDPSALTVNAQAYDWTGVVTKMELYNGNTLLATANAVKDLTVVAPNTPRFTAAFTLPANFAAGDYNLTVKAYDSYGASTLSNPYAIKVNRCADANEPTDNTASTGTALAVGGVAFSKIGSATDVDYYKITPYANTVIRLSGTTVAGVANLPVDYDMVVLAGSGKSTMPIAVSDLDGTAIETISFANLGADGVKTFFIKVYGYNGANSPSCYRLEAFANNGFAKNIVARPSQKGVIVEGMQSSLTLVPNPAANEVALVTSIETAGEYQLTINDLVGRTLRTETVALNAGDNVTPINISEMNKGMYIVRLWNQNQQLTQKLSVEK